MVETADLPRCHYCGVIATSIDHVPPLSVRAMLAGSGAIENYAIKDVPACHECNSAIGANAPFHLVDRKRIAKNHIRRKYARYLRIPN